LCSFTSVLIFTSCNKKNQDRKLASGLFLKHGHAREAKVILMLMSTELGSATPQYQQINQLRSWYIVMTNRRKMSKLLSKTPLKAILQMDQMNKKSAIFMDPMDSIGRSQEECTSSTRI
jgi:hypothetical protein